MSAIMIISMPSIFLFTIFLHVLPPAMIQSLPLAPALYVFGDSMFDSGNNNLLPTVAKANYLPYGVNFAKGVTGRFTNGKTVADFIAEFLGLPYSPPFMSIRRSTPLTGLNYASGSCGILPETGNLFVRSNDYLTNYLEPNVYDTSKRYPPQPFAQFLVDTLSKVFQRLYNLGGRKIIMFEIGPIGCIPSITRKKKHNVGQCVEETNQIVSFFNQRLPTFLNNLTSSLHGSTFILGQANFLGYDAIINPSKYGLEDSTSPCCTTWANGTSGCIPFVTPCLHAYKNFFWDAFHLTEAAYSLIATRCFNDSICSPFNIKELVRM
ncbi:GDSL esterase/lipase 7-like isoform X2 [Carya illinoinensis]|uniref:GDSL esterase/lipase 7-like isoform X2 n=1 Tax=Carya illinoinensis TaxID=32201 RepID=UPI001C7204FD|nr:GDSL esterase/lipase 7-like isoform X2 [Carya illinoinensis]